MPSFSNLLGPGTSGTVTFRLPGDLRFSWGNNLFDTPGDRRLFGTPFLFWTVTLILHGFPVKSLKPSTQ